MGSSCFMMAKLVQIPPKTVWFIAFIRGVDGGL